MDFVKQRNITAVYKTIVNANGISRVQIARECNLAGGSVTRITKFLVEQGLVHEVDRQQSERGRKATSLSPKMEVLQILAARAGRKHIHIGLCDINGNLLAKQSTPIQKLNQDDLGRQIITELLDFQTKHAEQINRIAGIGLTLPGVVDAADGIIKFTPHIDVQDWPLAQQVSDATGIPCYLGNSIASMTLAEHQFGAAKGSDNNLYVRVHNGVGLGMILDGKLYEGKNQPVGEIGHIQVNPLGKRCYCGNFGCLETELSNKAIENHYSDAVAKGLSETLGADARINDICNAAEHGNIMAQKLLSQAAGQLGHVLSGCVNLLRPECIVFDGEMFNASVVLPAIEHCLNTQTISVGSSRSVSLKVSRLGGNQWLGGFALVRRALLERGLLMKVVA
ncbi:ROK family protein [Endozoicomonas montiporae]|nr:ROK family protein [Endozoicomonas montiporae]